VIVLKKLVFCICVAMLLVQPFTAFADYAKDWWNYDYTSYEEAYDDAYSKGYNDAYAEMRDELEQLEQLEEFGNLQDENYQLKEENAELQDKFKKASRGELAFGITTTLLILFVFFIIYKFGSSR
jgi:cell shape-determining protein MreC